MRRDRLIQLVAAGVLAVALTGSALLRGPIETEHDEKIGVMQLTGPFRAIAVNYLWIRSQELKDEGRLYDAKQLREMICDMMPYYPGAWNFLSWDMAWNISVSTHTPQERWMWIRNGITLLRDRGLVHNPDDLLMHKQIAWTFFSKIGGTTDEMHREYKTFWAEEVDRILGQPPPTGTTEEVIDHFRAVAEQTADKLHADPEAMAFLAALDEVGVGPGETLLVYYNRFSADPLRGQVVLLIRPPADPEADRLNRIGELMTDPRLERARAKVVAFARRKVLVETFRMDPDWMLALMAEYGPLDWRSVHPHAMYWATRGLYLSRGLSIDDLRLGAAEAEAIKRAKERKESDEDEEDDESEDAARRRLELSRISRVNTERIVLGALKALTRTGQITYRRIRTRANPRALMTVFDWEPDWRFIDVSDREYLVGGADLAGGAGKLTSDENVLRDGHITYLTDAVLLLYVAGREADARQRYDWLRENLKPDEEDYQLDLHEFCLKRFPQTVSQTFDLARAFRHGALLRAYKALAAGRMGDYRKYRAFARKVYGVFKTDIGKAPRMWVRPFIEEEAYLIIGLLLRPEAYRLKLPTVMKSTVYRALEPTLQKMVYPYIGPAMRIECLGQAEWQKRERAARAVELGHPVEPTVYDFDKAFPPPLDVPTPEPVPTPVPRP